MTAVDNERREVVSEEKTRAEATPAEPSTTHKSRRSYLRITPTTTSVATETVHTNFQRFHDIASRKRRFTTENPLKRLREGLLGRSTSDPRATLEWLLATDGRSDTPLTYYLGIVETEGPERQPTDTADAQTPELDALRRIARGLFPSDYEIDVIRWHPRDCLDREHAGERDDENEADAPNESDADKTAYTSITYTGRATRRRDWQTQLVGVDAWDDSDDTDRSLPLTELVTTLAESEVPMVYQALLTPNASWRHAAEDRRRDLLNGRDTRAARWLRDLGVGDEQYGSKMREKLERRRDDDDHGLRASREQAGATIERIQAIDSRDPDHSFFLTARLVARGDSPQVTTAVQDLTGVFGPASGPYHKIGGTRQTGTDACDVRDALVARRPADVTYERPATNLPGVANTSAGIVVDPQEAPVFCLVDGASLTPEAMAAVGPTPGERARPTGPLPSRDVLTRYRESGFTLGQVETGTTETSSNPESTEDTHPIRVPPALQRLHLAWFGKTGSGKTTSALIGLLDNHDATDGATLIVDQKGDGMATELQRMQYARTGSLEDVIHIDCSQQLPAISFFDIRDQLAAGVPRETAVEDVVAHYGELLAQLHHDYDAAGVSVKLIDAVLKALFDPVHGSDAFSHGDFRETLTWMAEHQAAPASSNPDVERVLESVVANGTREFTNIMSGVTNRVDEVTLRTRLNTILNHVEADSPAAASDTSEATAVDDDGDGDDDSPETHAHEHPRPEAEGSTEPAFDLLRLLDEDVIIVFDFGGLRERSQHAMTLLVLSNLWTALRRRVHRREQLYGQGQRQGWAQNGDAVGGGGSVGDEGENETDLTADELPLVNLHVEEASTVAGSGLFSDLLKQARSFGCSVTLSMQYPAQLRHATPETYDEVLNNVSTIVTGNVPLDRDLAARLATEDMEPQEVANRLRALSRGEWLCALPADFGAVEPRPFSIESPPLPPGHPDGPEPLSTSDELHFEIAQVRRDENTRRDYALTVTHPSTVQPDGEMHGEGGENGNDAETDDTERFDRVDSALPFTRRLPSTVSYEQSRHALDCTECENRYDASDAGMVRAINCCSSLSEVDTDDIPITALNLKLTREERVETGCSDTQLLLLQAVHNAQQLRYESPAYDLLHDSMLRLVEYVGATNEDVQALIDAGYLTHDTDHPHRLYSVTPEGRHVLGEGFREGVDHGHGKGDLEETSAHVLMVEVGRRYLQRAFVDESDSRSTRVVPYYETDDCHRIDCVALDSDGDVVVALEAERVNHDLGRAAPSDFDKMAACEPDEAIWVALNRVACHRVLAALNNPLEGEPRVEKTYSENTPPQQFSIDTPGLTAIYPVEWLRDRIE